MFLLHHPFKEQAMTRRINMARWQPHVEEARRRGMSIKAYAAEQGRCTRCTEPRLQE